MDLACLIWMPLKSIHHAKLNSARQDRTIFVQKIIASTLPSIGFSYLYINIAVIVCQGKYWKFLCF